ncbi:unnamed protein product, partial [Amoebophrya sp. A120]
IDDLNQFNIFLPKTSRSNSVVHQLEVPGSCNVVPRKDTMNSTVSEQDQDINFAASNTKRKNTRSDSVFSTAAASAAGLQQSGLHEAEQPGAAQEPQPQSAGASAARGANRNKAPPPPPASQPNLVVRAVFPKLLLDALHLLSEFREHRPWRFPNKELNFVFLPFPHLGLGVHADANYADAYEYPTIYGRNFVCLDLSFLGAFSIPDIEHRSHLLHACVTYAYLKQLEHIIPAGWITAGLYLYLADLIE